MKRKRQLREFIEHHDEGYSDDFFNSTPYKQMQPAKVMGQLSKVPTIFGEINYYI